MDGAFEVLTRDLYPVLIILRDFAFPIVKAWWWIGPPFLFIKPFVSGYLWWRQSLSFKERKYVLLEIRLPEEIVKPIKAMEHVFASLHPIISEHDPGNFREKWIEGDSSFFPSLSLEIVSVGGQTRFFIRVEKPYRQWVESALYSQYPEIEITEAQDYTDTVPQDIPNDDWDLELREFILKKPNAYPIKTYPKFEAEREPKEEQRVDPMARLLEGLSALKEGEQIWLQFVLGAPKKDWVKDGEGLRDKLVKRPGPKPPPKPMVVEAAEVLIKGVPEKKEEIKGVLPPEMTLSPGEKEVVSELEKKISKQGFGITIRVMYLGKKEAFFKPHLGLPINFLVSFNTENLNRFGGSKSTSTKVKSTLIWFWDKRRAFLRKRKAFRRYKMRVSSLFPRKGGTSVLNVEELATLFHFPGRTAAPAPEVPRLQSKRGEAPPGLPME